MQAKKYSYRKGFKTLVPRTVNKFIVYDSEKTYSTALNTCKMYQAFHGFKFYTKKSKSGTYLIGCYQK